MVVKDERNSLQILLLIVIFSVIVYILYVKDYVNNMFSKENKGKESFQVNTFGTGLRGSGTGITSTNIPTTQTITQQSIPEAPQVACPNVDQAPNASVTPRSDPMGCLNVKYMNQNGQENVYVYVDSKYMADNESQETIQGYVKILRINNTERIVNSRRTNRITLDTLNLNDPNQKFIVEYINVRSPYCILKLASDPTKLLSYTATNPTYQLGISSRFPQGNNLCLGHHPSQIWWLQKNKLCENQPLEYLSNYNSSGSGGSNFNSEQHHADLLSALNEILDNRQGNDQINNQNQNRGSDMPCFNIKLPDIVEQFQNPDSIGERDSKNAEKDRINDILNNTDKVNRILSSNSTDNIDCALLDDYISLKELSTCNCNPG